ncbi:hypothetical protein Tco_1431357, partial [Tanacetum coccineum]
SLSQDVYLGHVFSDNAATVWRELQETYDRVDGSIFDILTKLPDCTYAARNELSDHAKLLKLMQFPMGLDDVYQPIRSNIMTREILPEAKDAFLIISREESYRRILSSSVKAKKPLVSVFVARQIDNNNNRNKNCSNYGNNANRENYDSLLCKNCGLKGHTLDRRFELILLGSGGTSESKTSGSSTVSLTNEQVMKLMSLLNEKSCSTAQANMARANQHITNSTKNMFNIVDVTELKLTVGHPNRTLAQITHMGSLRLNNDVVLFDVLVEPEGEKLSKSENLFL